MKTFIISDTHFSHSNILTFFNDDGSKVRSFSSTEEMDETMIDNWNKVVSDKDKVYHLGDLTFSNTALNRVMPRLKGTKVLIKGNHDNLKLSAYAKYFKDIRSYHILDKFVMSHIPIHPDSLYRWKANLHGHLHSKVLDDPKYVNLSVERINFTPKNFEEIRASIN